MPHTNQNRRNLKKEYENGGEINNTRVFSEIMGRLLENSKVKEEGKGPARDRKRKRCKKKDPSIKVIGMIEMKEKDSPEKIKKLKESKRKKVEKETRKENENRLEGNYRRNLTKEWVRKDTERKNDVKSGNLINSIKQENLTLGCDKIQKIKNGQIQKKKTSSPRVNKSKRGKVGIVGTNVKKITAYFEAIGNSTSKNETDTGAWTNTSGCGRRGGGGLSSVQARGVGGVNKGKYAATHGQKLGIIAADVELKD